MNIGIMQFSNMSIQSKAVGKNQSVAESEQSGMNSSKTKTQSNSFGEIFNQAISSSSKNEMATAKEETEPLDFEALENLVGAQSMEDVADLLGVPYEEGLLTIPVGEDGKALAIDDMMDMDQLLSVLGMDSSQLLNTIEKLGGGKAEGIEDVWQVIDSVLGQESELLPQLATALLGEQKVSPKEAEQLLQFLKLAQVAGKNTDLFVNQSQALEQLNNLLKDVVSELNLQSNKQATQSTLLLDNRSGKISLPGFEQVVQKIVETTETAEKTEVSESSKTTLNTLPPSLNITNSTKTITITLPTEKGAQSEALAKEIQNLLNRSQISNTPGTTRLLLKLYPENLGSIRIEIMQQDGVLSARLLTSTTMGKELLDNQLHQLKTAFANANIQMDRIDIAQSLQETDRNLRDQGQFGQQFKQQPEQEEHEQDDHEEETEKLSFSDYLINEEV